MRKTTLLFLLLSIHLTAFSVPVLRSQLRVRLADGTTVIATRCGDEHYSWLEDETGMILERLADGTYVRTTDSSAAAAEVATRRSIAARRIGSRETAPLPATGSPRVPIVLVEFADSTFHVADTREDIRKYYDLFCNGSADSLRHTFRDRTNRAHYGSIRDYFRYQSDSIFTPLFTIIGPVRLASPVSYYGQNSSDDKSKDLNYSQFCRDAIVAAINEYGSDWSAFDNKGKGNVDMIFFIYAGAGENTANVSGLIWPKESTSRVTYNGITFATTGCCCENTAVTDSESGVVTATYPDGIGVMCHELSHALGLPDFYDTKYKGFGMDLWSLMDYGCYAGSGRQPCGYTAYERDFMGWRSLVTLSEPGTYTLQPTSRGGRGMKIVNPDNANEYYVLENRQRLGWDQTICAIDSGLLVTHVDFAQSRWNSNTVNTEADHQRMTIIAANNRYIGTTATKDGAEIRKTWLGNLYPFEGNDSLTAYSTPAATVFTGGYMRQDINHIRHNADMSMSFYFGNDYKTAIHDLAEPTTPSDAGRQPAAQGFFDLCGRRVARPIRPGIYVSEGRKRVIR